MFQGLGVKFIVHLGQFCALRCRQLALGAIKGAGVVLHTQEIILLDIRQVVGELLLPCGLCKGFSAGLGLQVVEGKGQPHLDMGTDSPDGLPGGGVGAHDQQIPFGGALADKDFGLGITKDAGIFRGSKFHILHHLLEIHAHLHGAFGGFARGRSGLGRLLGHQAEPLGDGRQLQPHIGLVDGADIVQLAAQVLHYIADIPPEILHGGLGFPAALGNQPFGAGKMQQSDHRLHPVGFAAGNNLAIMLYFGVIKLAFLRLDARPLHGKAVGAQPGLGQQADILLIPVVMVTGNAAGFGKAGVR